MRNYRKMQSMVMFVTGLFSVGCAEKEPTEELVAAEEDVQEADSYVEFVPELDLFTYFTEESLFSDENLKLQVNADVVKTLNDGAVWRIPFLYRSSVWHGNPWDHPSVLYVPTALNPDRAGTIAIIQQGTDDLDPGIDQDGQFGVDTAIELGIPVAVLGKVPYPTLFNSVESDFLSSTYSECFEAFLVEADLDNCARKLTWGEGKEAFSWALETPIVKAYARSIKAIELMPQTLAALDPPLEGVPSFSVNKVIVGGAGKRARALWLLARLDPRIAGIWVAAEDRGNLKEFYENMSDVWDGGFTGVGPEEALTFLRTEYGTTWEYFVDPYRHMEELADRLVFISRGTNDPYSPLGSYARYEDSLPSHQLLIVPNSGYGMGTLKHVTSWRSLISAASAGGGVHRVEVQVTRTGSDVEVVILAPDYAAGPLVTVEVFVAKAQALADDRDLRDAVWASFGSGYDGELADGRQRHRAELNVPSLEYWALFAHVTFTDGAGVEQEVSSPVWLSWEN